MPVAVEASFQPMTHGGHRLWIWHAPPPSLAARGAVLYVHPWAEEMNKSRRMAALAARALATDGWTVLQPDLAGCGDSTGELDAIDADTWVDDLMSAVAALRARQPQGPLWLWGLRAGALWCAALAARLQHPHHLLLWQPVTQGKTVLQQFLRLQAAAQLGDDGVKSTTQALRSELAAGRSVQVAGYRVGAALAGSLEAVSLDVPTPGTTSDGMPCRMVWLETCTASPPSLSPAAHSALPRWKEAGWRACGQAVEGPAFWQTAEVEDAPQLVDATVASLR